MTDYARWLDETNLLYDWKERTQLIATLIAPYSRVLEFGAGRQYLRECLPEGCHYIPSDIVPRRDALTWICDLNEPVLPLFPPHDVAVFAGVLEYVYDVPRVLRLLTCKRVVASYAVCAEGEDLSVRHANGWVNHYTLPEWDHLLESVGFKKSTVVLWRGQAIYQLARS